jgi:type II secretory pathway pseudopilin PulG
MSNGNPTRKRGISPFPIPPRGISGIPTLPRRTAISLLEVVLALAILGVASAYLAQSMQLAAQNAIRAQRLTQAELVMESVMNQVIAGVIPAQSVTWAPYTTTSANGNWNYMINVAQAEMQGMIGVQVAVQESRASGATDSQVPDLVATRWIIDPSLELDVPPEQSADSGTGTGGTGQSTSGQSGGNAAGTGGVQ